MRRPFDWLVICLSLLVLWANRVWLVEPPSRLQAEVPTRMQALSRGQAPALPLTSTERSQAAAQASPFAYIREDGTLEYLPVAEPPGPRLAPPRQFERIHAGNESAAPSVRDPASAVYTWSTVVGAVTDPPTSHVH